MLPQADQYTLDALKANADNIEEVSALETYLGICKPGTTGTDADKEAAPIWTIIKITQSGAVYPIKTTVRFAGGIAAFSHVWNDRAALDYKIKTI